jgi:hypothetical protein
MMTVQAVAPVGVGGAYYMLLLPPPVLPSGGIGAPGANSQCSQCSRIGLPNFHPLARARRFPGRWPRATAVSGK